MLSSNSWDDFPPGEGASSDTSHSQGHSGGLPLEDLRALLATSEDVTGEPVRDPALDDLALQACHNTSATGAAIALAQGYEFVCVSTYGPNAPDFGVHLNMEQGLSAICLQTREMQRCDDTETDPRVNADACRELGVRSVLVVPLLLGEQLVGLFELFSPVAEGFCDRDVQALYSLSWRVLDHLAMPSEGEFGNPLTLNRLTLDEIHVSPAENAEPYQYHFEPTPELQRADLASLFPAEEEEAAIEELLIEEPSSDGAVDEPAIDLRALEGDEAEASPEFYLVEPEEKGHWARILTLAVVVAAVVLGWALARGGQSKTPAAPPEPAQHEQAAPNPEPTGDLNTAPVPEAPVTRPEASDAASPAPPPKAAAEPTPSQGLVVYRNGKVIFKGAPSRRPSHKAERPSDAASDTPSVPPAEIPSETAKAYLLHEVQPEYPAKARAQHVQGPVVLQTVVDDEGQVQQITVLSGDSRLVTAALEAVRHWQFKPYAPNGHPAPFETRITVNFTLPNHSPTEN
ncbi:MAG TPA: TonB family protein [Terriglobales bacterium]|nr:TonB family protein [Terriglobales bacterium]